MGVISSRAADEALDALQDDLEEITCKEPSLFAQLPRCVFILIGQRYLTATQRAALAASEKYAREELVTKGELAPSVWRVTWLSQAAAVRMLSTVPPRAYAPLQWTSELMIIDSDTPWFTGGQVTRYWKGLSLLIANAPALSVVRIRKAWRLSPLVFAAVARRPAMRLEIPTLTPERLDDLGVDARQLVREERLTCSKLVCSGPWPFGGTWLDLLKQATLVELDLSENQTLVELPEAIAALQSLRVLRANRTFNLRRLGVLARGPPALEVLTLNENHQYQMQLPAQLACASSLVRLELFGIHSLSVEGDIWTGSAYCKEAQACEIVKGLPQLRRLVIDYTQFERFGLDEFQNFTAHPCFVPSAIEFLGAGLGLPRLCKLREHILGAVRSLSPCQKQDLELVLGALDEGLRGIQPGYVGYDVEEVTGEFLACLRGVLADRCVSLSHVAAMQAANRGGSGYAPTLTWSELSSPGGVPQGRFQELLYHSITLIPAHSGKSFEELRLQDYQQGAGPDDARVAAASAAFAAAAAEHDRLAAAAAADAAAAAATPLVFFPNPISDERDRLSVAAAAAAVAAPATPFVFRSQSPASDEPFVFGANR